MIKTVKKKSAVSLRKKNKIFKEIEKLAGYGLTEKEIANVLDFSNEKLNRFKKNPLFSLAMKKGIDKADSNVVESLYKRATGFVHDDLYIAQYQGEIITKKIQKHFAPDTTAIIYWLNNRKSNNWRRKQESDGNLSDEEILKLKSIALNEAKEKI